MGHGLWRSLSGTANAAARAGVGGTENRRFLGGPAILESGSRTHATMGDSDRKKVGSASLAAIVGALLGVPVEGIRRDAWRLALRVPHQRRRTDLVAFAIRA